MIEKLLKNEWIDDYRVLEVHRYISMRKKLFDDKDDFHAIKAYQSMVVISMSYPNQTVKYRGKGYGRVSRYSYGTDYHRVFGNLFKELESQCKHLGIKAKGYADVSPIDERFAGFLSGLGFIGKNQFLIHPNFGTYHYLGVLLIDQPMQAHQANVSDCGSCVKCIEACPTDALTGGFHESRCLSYQSQAKIPLSIHAIQAMNTMIFGCDICQEVCPKNISITSVDRSIFQADEASQLHLETLLKMSNKSIIEHYRNYAFSFRGGLVLKRNAFALLYNQKQFQVLPLMKEVAKQYRHVPWFSETAKAIIDEMEGAE